MMKIAALCGALALAMTTASFAQTTGPSGQQDTNKPGAANPNSSTTSTSTDAAKPNTSGTAGTTTPGSTSGPSGGTPKPDSK